MKTLHLAILTALLATAATAQPFNFDISFALGTPQGSFQQSLERDSGRERRHVHAVQVVEHVRYLRRRALSYDRRQAV